MALANVTASPTFPEGTLLRAYPKLLWAGPPPEPGDAPRTAPVDSAEVDEHGFALFEALEDNAVYYVGAQVGTWQWRTIRTPPASGSSGGGGGGGGLSEAQIRAIIASEDLVGSKIRDLGSRNGTVVTDLDEGRVFLVNATADVILQNPTNTPTNGAATYVEYRVVTNGHKVSLPGLTKWSSGETPAGLDGSAAQVNIMVASYNNGASYEGLSSDNLPANVIRSAIGTAGQVLTSDGSKIAPANPVSLAGLLNQAEVDARIKALSILTGEHPTSATNAPANGAVPLGASSSTYTWTNLVNILTELTTHRIEKGADVAANATLTGGEHTFYRLTKKGITVTLPATTLTLAGELLILENTSEGPVKIKGPIGAEAVIEKELEPGEAWLLWKSLGGAGEEWRIVSRSRQTADVVVPDINTTGLTSAQITTAFNAAFAPEKPPRNAQMIVDNTNKKVLFFNASTKKWLESAAFTVI